MPTLAGFPDDFKLLCQWVLRLVLILNLLLIFLLLLSWLLEVTLAFLLLLWA